MAWTDRDDDVACCGAEPGPVAADEQVARLLHENIYLPEDARFTRAELLPPRKREISNTCGDADGASLVRCRDLSDEDVRSRAKALAGHRPSRGALLADASTLRAIRVDEDDHSQNVFVYDDPKVDDARHSVLRVRETLTRTRLDSVRVKIVEAFKRSIDP